MSFNFGRNWQAFSENSLNAEKFAAAVSSLQELLGDRLSGKSFIDLGCGSGLFAIAAARLGACPIMAVDINPLCIDVAKKNQEVYGTPQFKIDFSVASVLDASFVASAGHYDIVYSWGVLHHTGDMWQAIRNAAAVVNPGGRLVIAIYNRHWTSPLWAVIKRFYNRLPGFMRKFGIYFFIPIIFIAKWVVTKTNPLRQQRGMDFYYNIVDWVGGYPYEYASVEQIKSFCKKLGFETEKIIRTQVPTGCNEFVFSRTIR